VITSDIRKFDIYNGDEDFEGFSKEDQEEAKKKNEQIKR